MGVAMSILLLFLWLNVSIRQSSYNSSLVFLYLCYILVSIQGYLYNGIPISVYLSELGTQVLPIIFFFIAFSFSDEEKEKFYKTYIYAISLSLIIGLFFYIFPSAQYSAYISSHFSSNYDSHKICILIWQCCNRVAQCVSIYYYFLFCIYQKRK